MKNFMRKFKKWMLRNQIKRCTTTIMQLKIESESYHELILKKKSRGVNESIIDRLRLERNGLIDTCLELIKRKDNLKDQLNRV